VTRKANSFAFEKLWGTNVHRGAIFCQEHLTYSKKEWRLTGLATFYVGTAFWNTLRTERYKEGYWRGRQGRRRKLLLDDLKVKGGYRKLKEEALDRTVWRTHLGRDCGYVVSQTRQWMTHKLGTYIHRYDYTLITNLIHWLLFIYKILFSSTCFEHQVLIFRRT